MIEATCTTCGNVNRISETEIQPGAKFVPCASCKSRVGLPSITQHAVIQGSVMPAAMPAVVPAPPKPGTAEASGPVPGHPSPRTGTRMGMPGAGSGRAVAGTELDLMPPDALLLGEAELPTPKAGGAAKLPTPAQPTSPARLNALASGPAALADAGISDLPAPKGAGGRTSPAVKVPAPISDLPAPKSKWPAGQRPSGQVPRPPPRPLLDLRPPKPSGIGELPPSPIGGIGDLPAPKRAGLTDPAALRQGLTDLPAPRSDLPGPRAVLPELARPSRTDLTGPAAAEPRPPRQGLDLDLPLPRSSGAPDLPPPRSGGAPDRSPPRQGLDLDLPLPRSSATPELPPPRQGLDLDLPLPRSSATPDLPARRQSSPDLPAPRQSSPDLPAPRHGIPDLPAPRQGFPDLPAPRQSSPDLPAPRQGHPDLPAPRQGHPDLPAPRQGLPDLPAPRQGHPDLPAPRQGLPDLPAPRQGLPDLPAPRQGLPDLPAPRQGLPDLPAPRQGLPDLPAPKQGLDDLPVPRHGADELPVPKQDGSPDLPVPVGFFDDLLQPVPVDAATSADVPAPKGFFDDLPDRAHTSRPTPAEPPAPKGFFDDLPDRAHTSRPAPAEPPAPKGFFDDLPGRVSAGKAAAAGPPGPKGFFDDISIPLRETEPGDPDAAPVAFESIKAFDPVQAPPAGARQSVFDATVQIRSPSARFGAARATGTVPAAPDEDELETRPATPKLQPKRAKAAREGDPQVGVRRARLIRIAAIAAIALLGLGAAGFYLYRRHAASQEQRQTIEEHLAAARAAFAGKDPKRWERAAAAARQVLELDEHHAEALALGAEALLADGTAYGLNAAGKAAQARKLLATAAETGAEGPALERARALSMATAKQPDPAKLEQLRAAAPKDPALALYAGWAYAARGDHAAAALAFTQAIPSEPLKILALQGRGRAKLALGSLEDARADFTSILDLAKDHLAAQVGLAAALPASKAQQQETDLLAILARKDLAAGDPRAVVQAWLLAAEVARRGGKLDAARERYRKAQAAAPQDVWALTGLAELEILDGKLETAAETIDKAIALEPDNVRVLLGFADVAIRQKRFDEAAAKLSALAARKPPPPVLEQARIKLAAGRLLEAQGKDDAAVDAFVEAAGLAGQLDLAPALTAVTKLGQLAEAAIAVKSFDRAAELRARGDRLIAPFAAIAKRDPQLALVLGMAYLQSGDATKAEPWLRRVAEARPDDAVARYQLARSLSRLERYDDAIDALQQAMKLDERRGEIGLELARTYETSGRDTAAGEVYEKLLARGEPSLELRARAGRFFARRGDYAKAGAQGAKIHEADPAHPAGLYLKAEGLLATGKAETAAKLFRGAVDGDRDPQYLDGQGRAAEVLESKTGDAKFHDVALRAYSAAAELAPTMFNPHVGRGRIYLARREAAKAIPPLLEASKLRPDDPEVTRLIGLAYKELQEKRVAIEWLVRAYRLSPAAATAWHLGQIYSEANAPRDAIGAYTNATRLGLEDEKAGTEHAWLTEALYQLGRINMDSGNEKAAKAAWEKFVRRNPKPGAQLDEVRRELATTLQRY